MLRRLALAAVLALAPSLAVAGEPIAMIAPTVASPTDSSNRIATTAWVNSFLSGGIALASGKLLVGSAGNIATAQTPSGDLTMSNAGVFTFGTVNANVGAFGSATQCASVTVNAKGLVTAASQNVCTPAIASVTGLGAGVATFLGTPSSANLRAALTDETGTGLAYFQGGDLGTPSAGVLTNATGLPIATGVSGLGAGCATFLATPSSANLRGCVSDETGTGLAYFQGGALGSPSSAGTIPAFTLGGTVAGGGNQINNVIIGTTTPLAGTFTTVTANTSASSPIHAAPGAYTFQSNGSTFAGGITTGQQWFLGTNTAPAANAVLTLNKNATPVIASTSPANVVLQLANIDGANTDIVTNSYAGFGTIRYHRAQGTAAAPAATVAGNTWGANFAYGYSTTASAGPNPAGIGFLFGQTEATCTTTACGARVDIYGVPAGTVTQTVAASFQGGLMVGTTTDYGVSNVNIAGSIATKAPVTLTGTSGTVSATDSSVIFNASGTFTATLPAAASYSGRWLNVKSIAAQTVNSASSNVVPLAGGAAGTALLASGAGKWAQLQSDGTNWVTMSGN